MSGLARGRGRVSLFTMVSTTTALALSSTFASLMLARRGCTPRRRSTGGGSRRAPKKALSHFFVFALLFLEVLQRHGLAFFRRRFRRLLVFVRVSIIVQAELTDPACCRVDRCRLARCYLRSPAQ